MAPAIGAAVLSALAIEASATTAAVVGSLILTGASIGLNYAISGLSGQQKKPQRSESQQAVLNQAMGPRVRAYGYTMLGGTRAFWDARNGELYQLIMLASDRIDGIHEFWIGDTMVTTSDGGIGGNVTSGPMAGKVFYEVRLGDAEQPAMQTLLDRYPDVWTPQHKLNGIACVLVVFAGVPQRQFSNVYPQGYNTSLRFVVRGARVWDPMSAQDPENWATWTFSELASDCILDFLRHPDGMRIPLSRVDVPSWQDFHALCAEQVARKDDSTEARYRLWGAYALNEAPKDVLARMCAACDGQLVQGASGKIGIRGGKWSAPLVNIPTEHIVTAQLAQGNDRLDTYNRLKVSYTDPDNYYQQTEMQARDDLASQTRIGVIDETLDLAMVPSWTQAARLAKIAMAKANPIWKGSLGTSFGGGLAALGEETVQITYAPVPGLDPIMNAPCLLTSFSVRGDLSGCDVGFVSIPASAYDWDPAGEEPPRPVTPQAIAQQDAVTAPEGVVSGLEISNISGGVPGVVGTLAWTAPTRTDVQSEAQYKLSTADDTGWLGMTIGPDGVSARTPLLTDGQAYDFRVRFTTSGAQSDWTSAASQTAVTDPTAPGAPTSLVANGGSGQAIIAWTAPNSANFARSRLYRGGASATFGTASLIATIEGSPNQSFDMTDSGLAPGDYRYFVTAENRSGVASTPAGPAAATVT